MTATQQRRVDFGSKHLLVCNGNGMESTPKCSITEFSDATPLMAREKCFPGPSVALDGPASDKHAHNNILVFLSFFYARQLYRQVLLRARISYGDSVCPSVCLSVGPSVTTRYGFKARRDRDSGSSPYDTLESLVS